MIRKKQTCTLTCMLYVSPILLYYFKIVTKIPANSNLSGTHEGKFMFYMFFLLTCATSSHKDSAVYLSISCSKTSLLDPEVFLDSLLAFACLFLLQCILITRIQKLRWRKINFPIFSKSRLFVRNWQKWCYILAWRARIPESVFTIRLFLMKKISASYVCFDNRMMN